MFSVFGVKSVGLIFNAKSLTNQSKATDVKNLFGKITHLEDKKIRKIQEMGLYGKREFHVPFWSMMYLQLKLKSMKWTFYLFYKRAWIKRYFHTISYARLEKVASELRLQFKHSKILQNLMKYRSIHIRFQNS